MKRQFLPIVTTLLLALAHSSGVIANGSRLTVINEIIDAAAGVEQIVPLYLSRLGTYYAELYFEPIAPADDPRTVPLDLAFTISFLRRQEPVLSRDIAISLAPGEHVTTLFFLHSPSDLPQRTGLDVVVNFHDVDPRFNDYYEAVRLQMTRKVQIAPFKF
jgi:hypothetical protein